MNTRFLLLWLASSMSGLFIAGAFLAVLSPCAMLTMVGSGFLGAWILYHAGVLLLAIATSSAQALFLHSMAPFRFPWIVSSSTGWLAAAVLGLTFPFSTTALLSLWIAGGFLSGALQWAAVFRTRRAVLWIPASTIASLAVPVIASAALAHYSVSSGPPAPSEDVMTVLLALVLPFLASAGIAFLSILRSSAISGLFYIVIFRPKHVQAA